MRKLYYGNATNKSAPNVRFAIEKGFFADEGIDLEIRLVYGGPQLAKAFAAGEVEIGEFGSPPALTAIGQGAALKIIGSGMRRKFLMYLGVRADIADWDGLRGKRMGLLTRGSCNDWLAQQMWAQAGLDPATELEVVEIEGDYPKLLAQMSEGRFEAVLTIEPDMSEGESRGVLRVWAAAFDDAYLPRYQWVVMAARLDFLARDPAAARAVLRGCERASRYMVDNPDEWADFLVRAHGVSAEAAGQAVARERPHVATDCAIDMVGLQEAIELQRRLGAFDRALRAEDVVDLRFQPDLTATA